MNATIAETLIGQYEIGHNEKIGNDYQICHQIVEVDSADDSMIFSPPSQSMSGPGFV